MNPTSCSSTPAAECTAASCRWRCAVEVIDELLGHHGAVTGSEADLLLDLRWQLGQRANAETVIRLFCELRHTLERSHYLACFRIRRWLENHLVAEVRICPAAEPVHTPVKLDHYCVEPIRRVCLCAALGRTSVLLAPRLRFAFTRVTSVPQVVHETRELVRA